MKTKTRKLQSAFRIAGALGLAPFVGLSVASSPADYSSTNEGTYEFSCESSNVCVDYSITDEERADALKSQCANLVSDGYHGCSGELTCKHSNEYGDTTCTHTSGVEQSDHDAACASDPDASLQC